MERPPANWPSRFWPWSSLADTDRTFPTAIIAEPFPGAAPPFGSKDEDDEDEPESDETTISESQLCWGTFALDDPRGPLNHEDPRVRFVTLGRVTGYSTHGFAAAFRLVSTFALDALDDTMVDDPKENDAAIDHSKSDEPHDTSTAGFASAARLIAGQHGITSPVSKLPQAPPGSAEKAKQKERAGRGIEGGDESIDPMSTMDKFNWDHLPLPGLGQI